MRAPVSRPLPALFQTGPTPAIRVVQHQANRNLALLLLLLTFACITSFASAYYLFTTRWEARTIPHPWLPADTISQANVSMSADEKYLAYLPHSGFHNQRIAFENALLLAYALRRTLLVPPIRLGNKPIRYVEYDTLSQYHELSAKEGLNHCLRVPPNVSRPPECLQYFESTYLPWNWLVNITGLESQQPLVYRPNMAQAWIVKATGVEPSDVFTLRDSAPYQYRFLDNDSDYSPPQDRYSQDIYLTDLSGVQERLLQFGTLFGTSRLRLRDPNNLAYRRRIRQSMMFSNKDLLSVADSIAGSFKGPYVAIHLRTGDGRFKLTAGKTAKEVWWTLLRDVLGVPPSEKCELEQKFAEDSNNCIPDPACADATLECEPTPVSPISFLPSNIDCRLPRHQDPTYSFLNTPLYVATDISSPDTHPQLSIFRRSFPCIFFLGDFTNHLKPLDKLRSPYDQVELKPFLLPFLDALVAGKALKVVGTKGSTFSKFVGDIVWTSWHQRDPA
ncbi:hypothetical protein NLJ89_g8739 [Agrocybe chaxingu]|uniref:O-fucosyltransferase family protein n=1 Tax=Agrocybe chaxingu TaxID=84603 RepID=A0A9W8MSH5_9AGAR|nr:hypothetical protein NLJ89_g8739 [Agrocybe chaxingu]